MPFLEDLGIEGMSERKQTRLGCFVKGKPNRQQSRSWMVSTGTPDFSQDKK